MNRKRAQASIWVGQQFTGTVDSFILHDFCHCLSRHIVTIGKYCEHYRAVFAFLKEPWLLVSIQGLIPFCSWSLDIVRALDHLHNRNPIIMHRDLKPGNSNIYFYMSGRFVVEVLAWYSKHDAHQGS